MLNINFLIMTIIVFIIEKWLIKRLINFLR
jgi:hypothetical protein